MDDVAFPLTLLAGAVGVAFLSHNNNLSRPSVLSPVASNDELDNNNPLAAASNTPKSFHVDMNKQEWPELVGVDAQVAKQTIQGENPSITKVQILAQDSMVTMDYVTSRVRIFVNDNNVVARPPRVG